MQGGGTPHIPIESIWSDIQATTYKTMPQVQVQYLQINPLYNVQGVHIKMTINIHNSCTMSALYIQYVNFKINLKGKFSDLTNLHGF